MSCESDLGDSHFNGKYFLQTVDIDLGNYSWTPIALKLPFKGTYNGNNFKIYNLTRTITGSAYSNYGLFGYIRGNLLNIQLENVTFTANTTTSLSVGALVGYAEYSNIENCSVSNFTMKVITKSSSDYGGISGYFNIGFIKNCVVDNFTFTTTVTGGLTLGGIVGWVPSPKDYKGSIVESCYVNNSSLTSKSISNVGGIIGSAYSDDSPTGDLKVMKNYVDERTIITSNGTNTSGIIGVANGVCTICQQNAFLGTINASGAGIITYSEVSSGEEYCCSENYFGGTIVGTNCYGIAKVNGDKAVFKNNLSQGELNSVGHAYGISYTNATALYTNIYQYNVSNNVATVSSSSFSYYTTTNNDKSSTISDNYYNLDKINGVSNVAVGTGKTDSELKQRSTYDSWTDFDTYWIIDEKINNGYPMLRAHLSKAKVTGFDGSGTQADPYQIKTTADLQGMQSYYNDYDMIDEYWWKLINDIDISIDASELTINWTPIGYEGGVITGFNGHFDGNGKTISGLTITEQYENVGLFGKLASNATITNLNVTGSIIWDQAKYVGGIVGLMEDGAILTNCTFTGTITGYLNSGNIAAVGGLAGKYGSDAITGIANYDAYVYGTDNYTTFSRYTTTYSIA